MVELGFKAAEVALLDQSCWELEPELAKQHILTFVISYYKWRVFIQLISKLSQVCVLNGPSSQYIIFFPLCASH